MSSWQAVQGKAASVVVSVYVHFGANIIAILEYLIESFVDIP